MICLLLCGGILVFALNPDMTDALAQRLYGNGNNAETATEGATVSGNTENTDADGNIRVTLPNGTPGEMNGYVAPAIDQLRIPEDVSSKNGFQPIQPEEQEVPDQEAQNLEEILPTGDLGMAAAVPSGAGGAAGGLPTDICQCYGTDGTFCSGENRDSGRCEECF